MREVEPAVVAGVAVRRAEDLRLRPGLEGAGRGPDGVREVEREVVALGTLQQAEVLEARHAGQVGVAVLPDRLEGRLLARSEEHTSELQSLMRISYAVSCL